MPVDQQTQDNILRGISAAALSLLSGATTDPSKGGLSGGIGSTPIGQDFPVAPTAPTPVVYPVYASPASDARDSRTGIPIPPEFCCSYAEALAVMNELGGTAPQTFLGNVQSITPGVLGRLPFCITLPKSSKPGLMFNCEKFRIAKKSHGDGAPYTVDLDGQVHFPSDGSGRPTEAWDTSVQTVR